MLLFPVAKNMVWLRFKATGEPRIAGDAISQLRACGELLMSGRQMWLVMKKHGLDDLNRQPVVGQIEGADICMRPAKRLPFVLLEVVGIAVTEAHRDLQFFGKDMKHDQLADVLQEADNVISIVIAEASAEGEDFTTEDGGRHGVSNDVLPAEIVGVVGRYTHFLEDLSTESQIVNLAQAQEEYRFLYVGDFDRQTTENRVDQAKQPRREGLIPPD